MPFTNFPYGVTSFGIPQLGGSPFYPALTQGHLWVRGVASGAAPIGNDGNSGSSPDSSLLTMARAFALVKSGGVIHVTGNIREQISTPAGIFDVTVIGEGTVPRNADAHTGNNGYFTATWKPPASPVAATPLLTVQQQGWRFVNILFNPPSDAAALNYIRNAASGDAERDSSHSEIFGCRFAGGNAAIQISGTEIVHDLWIVSNIFNDSTYGIYSTAYYGRRFLISGNQFDLNTNHIAAGLGDSHIWDNIFGQFTTLSLSLVGGNGHNMITKNYLSGSYAAPQYAVSAATDEWAGNFNTLAGGITVADPA
jgi:hypothetical protein